MTGILTAQAPRGPHFFDIHKDGGIVTRTVQNHCSFKLPGQDYQETKPIIEPATDSLANLAPMRVQIQAPLQCGVGNANDADYQAAASCRLAEDPSVSITMQPLDALPSRLTEQDGVIRFPGVWPHATKLYQPAPNKLLGTLRLNEPGHPDTFKYSLDVPDGMRIEFANNAARILDDQGVERLHVLPPQGWDSSTVNPESLDGRKPIRVTMKEVGTIRVGGRDCVVVELEPNKDDLAGATYPVDVEQNPTVQVTGTVDLEDNFLKAYSAHRSYNYGASTNIIAHSSIRTVLIRIATIGAIPEEVITGFRLIAYCAWFGASGNRLKAFLVSNANDWVEGTRTGSVESGSSCWNACKLYQQNWAGHPILGCGLSGTDFDADPSPPLSPNLVTAQWFTFVLKPEWPPLWRDSVRAPNGIRLVSVLPNETQIAATENPSNPLFFEIDYEEVVGGAAQRFFLLGGN